MLVFKADQSESAAVIEPDAVVLVRGRLDHKDRGETKLVVQEAERFEPDAEELAKASTPAKPLELRIEATKLTPGLFEELKAVFEHHKGDADVHVSIAASEGESRKLVLGDAYRVRHTSGLRAELGHMLGPDSLAA
jgi:DNA polymerase-3 subunit alpha